MADYELTYPGGDLSRSKPSTAPSRRTACSIGKLLSTTGRVTFDPGYGNTASCTSAITFIDGDAGILRYRGYPIEQLAAVLDLPRDLVPADLRRAADRGRARARSARGSATTP